MDRTFERLSCNEIEAVRFLAEQFSIPVDFLVERLIDLELVQPSNKSHILSQLRKEEPETQGELFNPEFLRVICKGIVEDKIQKRHVAKILGFTQEMLTARLEAYRFSTGEL